MKAIPTEFDLNAHIVEIDCKVIPENDCCEISFLNLNYGVITAVKFIAQGFNVFGDCILVNGKEEFPLVLQDIRVEKNARLENYQVKLPDSNMRKIKLRESQICYDDGTVTTYTESNIKKYILLEYQDGDLSEDIRAARKAHYKVDFKYKPTLLDSGWVCGCGRFNSSNQQQCTACGLLMVNVLRLLDEGYDAALLEAYRRKRVKEDALEAAQKKKKKKNIIIVCAVCIVLIILVNNIFTREDYVDTQTSKSAKSYFASLPSTTNNSSTYTTNNASGGNIYQYHSCEAGSCSKKGTRAITGLSGKTEYYCEEHYKEMQDILGSLFGSTGSYSSSTQTSVTRSTSTGEKNALRAAQSYLSSMGFSYSGLIEQLEFEGYSHAEAKYAADNCGANWKEQAARVAKSYLNAMSFSRSGLIEQLQFEGFTYDQAVYGVQKNGY